MILLSRAYLAGFAALVVGAAPVAAETKVGAEPPIGAERTVSVGSIVAERYRHGVRRVAIPRAEVSQRILWAKVRIRPGTWLTPYEGDTGELKACGDGGCGNDVDRDGTFDRASFPGSVSVKLDAPVAYDQQEVPDSRVDSFRQIISYMGATSDALRLSYREFANDMARPAFTEELSMPLGKTFPQRIAVKNSIITILSIDGMGLRYRIEQ